MENNLLELLPFGEEFVEIIVQNGRQIVAATLTVLPLLLLAAFAA